MFLYGQSVTLEYISIWSVGDAGVSFYTSVTLGYISIGSVGDVGVYFYMVSQ